MEQRRRNYRSRPKNGISDDIFVVHKLLLDCASGGLKCEYADNFDGYPAY
jgi:hypothetical protein